MSIPAITSNSFSSIVSSLIPIPPRDEAHVYSSNLPIRQTVSRAAVPPVSQMVNGVAGPVIQATHIGHLHIIPLLVHRIIDEETRIEIAISRLQLHMNLLAIIWSAQGVEAPHPQHQGVQATNAPTNHGVEPTQGSRQRKDI
jgi:hypothetical protein